MFYTVFYFASLTLICSALEALVSIASVPVVNSFFGTAINELITAVENIQPEDRASSQEAALMADLALIFLPRLNEENLHKLFGIVKEQLKIDNASVQKKMYKILAQICKNHLAFFQSNEDEIVALLMEGIQQNEPNSKRARLLALRTAMLNITSANKQIDFIPNILPEVVLSIKEVSNKTRELAFDILIDVAKHVHETQSNGLQEFTTMVIGGLAGKRPRMISATVLALARLLFEFNVLYEREFVAKLVELLFELLNSNAREIVKSLLSFIKVALGCVAPEIIEPYLPSLVNGICRAAKDGKNRFRTIVRMIFERLARKFGFDTIVELVPEDQRKIMLSIKKEQQQKKQRREGGSERHAKFNQEAGDSSDDERQPREGQSRQWIVEANQEEPLDLLSDKSVKFVTSKDPTKKAKRADDTEFKSAKGKLIINDSNDQSHRRFAFRL